MRWRESSGLPCGNIVLPIVNINVSTREAKGKVGFEPRRVPAMLRNVNMRGSEGSGGQEKGAR